MEEDNLMYKWLETIPPVHWLYMKIAEPRVVRLLHFGIYLCMLISGIILVGRPPENYQDIIGLLLVYVLGGFLVLGGLLSAMAVLPGIWWLERVGIILLTTTMAIYVVIVVTLHGSAIGVAVPVAFIFAFILRWIDIRRYQLAPTPISAPRKE